MNVRRILKLMADFKRMYILANYIDTENRETAKDNVRRALTNQPHMLLLRYIKEDDALAWFIRDTGLSHPEAENILDTASSKGYIEVLPPNMSNQPNHLRLTPGKGRDLTYRIGFFRIGMWNEIVRHFNMFLTISLTILIAGVIGNIDNFINFFRWWF
jgi:hypothetical protein